MTPILHISEYAANSAQAAFYTAGTLAVVVGAFLALRRYWLEAPHDPCWNFAVEECRLRRHPDGRYVYGVKIHCTNQSKTPERIVRYWATLTLAGEGLGPRHAGRAGEAEREPLETRASVQQTFGALTPIEVGMVVAPNGEYPFGISMTSPNHAEYVEVRYCMEWQQRALGRGFKGATFNGQDCWVPVKLEDLERDRSATIGD